MRSSAPQVLEVHPAAADAWEDEPDIDPPRCGVERLERPRGERHLAAAPDGPAVGLRDAVRARPLDEHDPAFRSTSRHSIASHSDGAPGTRPARHNRSTVSDETPRTSATSRGVRTFARGHGRNARGLSSSTSWRRPVGRSSARPRQVWADANVAGLDG